jgi:hypothetical protein
MKNKKTDSSKEIPVNQLSMFPDLPIESPTKKLRIDWVLRGEVTPHIPVNKSIPEDSCIFSAWQEGRFTVGEERLDLGSVFGQIRSENLPFDSDGERRVLSLLEIL